MYGGFFVALIALADGVLLFKIEMNIEKDGAGGP